ncbi:MAG TPA: sulfurtransferase [Capillimicrobium sp.]|nr:sulfurtransferase [Capillimicrobium sp.]
MDDLPLLVDGDWLQARLDDPNLRLLDATTHLKFPGPDEVILTPGRESYEREHIPGAVFADLLGDLADPDAPLPITVPPSDLFAERIGALGVGEGTYVVVYDQFDASRGPEYYQFWAPRLWWHLRLEGFDRVAVLDGGLGLWKQEGRPVTGEPSPGYPPATFVPRRRPELLVSTDEVAAAIDDPDTVTINALSPEAYEAARVPGSDNVFFGWLVDPQTGRFKPVEELRAAFEGTGALDPGKRPVTYCGGGIAATVAALALARLGREDVAVYDGSMTAWTADGSRPVESGSR